MPLILQRGIVTDMEQILISVAGPNPYVTGGFDPGFPTRGALIMARGGTEMNGKTTGYVVAGDSTTKLVKVMQSGGAAAPLGEVANGTNLSTFTFLVEALWKP